MWILLWLIHLFNCFSLLNLMTLIIISLLKYLFLAKIFNWIILWFSINCDAVPLVAIERFFIIRWDTHFKVKFNYKVNSNK
jgi:hypothetical protein